MEGREQKVHSRIVHATCRLLCKAILLYIKHFFGRILKLHICKATHTVASIG